MIKNLVTDFKSFLVGFAVGTMVTLIMVLISL